MKDFLISMFSYSIDCLHREDGEDGYVHIFYKLLFSVTIIVVNTLG